MHELTILLFERIGLQLVLAFMLTRIPSFRYLLDRRPNLKTVFFHAIIFGAFGVIGTLSGILLREGKIVQHGFIYELASNEIMVGSGLVAIVIAGLMGGLSWGWLLA